MEGVTTCGIGYDTHRFAAGRLLILGGVRIESPLGLEGHSDADVLCHAIADAVLGAAGQADIGHHFPDTDPALKDISSLEILRKTQAILAENHAELINIDATLIAEAPKIAPHIAEMKQRIGGALKLPTDRIGIKATTNEGMGFIGRNEGIAAMAVAAVRRSTTDKH